MAFLILNFPIAFCKIYFFFDNKASNEAEIIARQHKIAQLAHENQLIETFKKSFNNNPSHHDGLLNQTLFLNAFNSSNAKMDPIEHLLDKITTNLYYLNFVLNFFLYSLNGSKFRKTLVRIFSFR